MESCAVLTPGADCPRAGLYHQASDSGDRPPTRSGSPAHQYAEKGAERQPVEGVTLSFRASTWGACDFRTAGGIGSRAKPRCVIHGGSTPLRERLQVTVQKRESQNL